MLAGGGGGGSWWLLQPAQRLIRRNCECQTRLQSGYSRTSDSTYGSQCQRYARLSRFNLLGDMIARDGLRGKLVDVAIARQKPWPLRIRCSHTTLFKRVRAPAGKLLLFAQKSRKQSILETLLAAPLEA